MTRAIILAGGRGERLDPLTKEIPKVLIPFQTRRLLDHVIDLYYKYNVYEIWLGLGHMFQKIIKDYPFPHIYENTPRGTGGWLQIIKSNKESLGLFKESFHVNNGDNLANINLTDMLKYHKEHDFVATIACVKIDDVRDYGAVNIKEGQITRFKEKQHSPKPKKGYINTGYYIFSPKIFDYIQDAEPNTIPEPISLEKDVFPKLAREGKLGAFTQVGQWFDVGTFERYKKAYEEWKSV